MLFTNCRESAAMNLWLLFCLSIGVSVASSAVIPDDDEIEEQGLYRKSDLVTILGIRNFEKKLYGQNTAWVIQFYNSYCGHCRAFSSKYKEAAAKIIKWKNIIRIGVLDCSVEENNEICRQFEIMAYPTIRYFHENYRKANGNIGDRIPMAETVDKFIDGIIHKMQAEQVAGHLRTAPYFNIASYRSYTSALNDIDSTYLFKFLIFEDQNSTVGSQIALDLNEYKGIAVKRVYDTSELAEVAGLKIFPAIIIIQSTSNIINITPTNANKDNILKAIISYLVENNYAFPEKKNVDDYGANAHPSGIKPFIPSADIVYYNDLEKTIKTSLHTEITRYKNLNGEPLQALLDYLDVIITSFPFRGNLKDYIISLRSTLATRDNWSGGDVYDTVKSLGDSYAPVYTTNLDDYVGCRGSLPKYRGYTCGLWTLFHTLTVNAARKQGNEGPKVLRAMHGYVKNFFGCTTCQEHFIAMAQRNRIFDVKENDKAVLWLWISHNEVNLRLAGDVTEDPEHPKLQFPSIAQCAECRLARGAWNLPAVYQYLQRMYGAENIQDFRRAQSAAALSASSFSNLDIGMLSLLYILSFIILILVIKYFLTKRLYRKRPYKHGRGKV